MLKQYAMFADYNRWANGLVYGAASELTDAEYRENRGAFFGSLHATLNHILSADRIWMKRFTGSGDAPTTLDSILYEDLETLSAAREREDRRIADWVDTLDAEALAGTFSYTPVTRPGAITQPLWPALSHLFNHQTHHRGQCHMTLTALGKPSLSLDLNYFLHTDGKRWLSA
ncbi:DinB family protein [Rhizobium metallidurans]|uniref:Putative damage-inducible protein DinB n=1 Tax=Rhizobium metallidurans TaxID=1265931 RepID=A0A7W6G9S8_9HYPH|nr:DinB family protein [Rhizobium metallidurans]MBB3963878.1 putative damage-inducible protein DinB [Rhizobium metallidurans]